MKRLQEKLEILDRKPYGAYRSVRGTYSNPQMSLHIVHVQGDPFASPSLCMVSLDWKETGFPEQWRSDRGYSVPLCDCLARGLAQAFSQRSNSLGSGNSGQLGMPKPGQEILARSSVCIDGNQLLVRFTVGLPADGRRIKSQAAIALFFQVIPEVITANCLLRNLNQESIEATIRCYQEYHAIAQWLRENEAVAFVANQSHLARRAGDSEKPLSSELQVPFHSPDSLTQTITLPSGELVTGMAIPKGVTLVVGGGFHGKSTLLKSLQHGIYPHIPGDGRERICAIPETVKVRAEDGRPVTELDISNFIRNLPSGIDTERFSTLNASGSTSQASGILEALEAGARLLLLDEDTCATNFMIRDEKMARLIHEKDEPIVPFVCQVQPLYQQLGVSTLLVMGGSGDYFSVADTVIALKEYVPADKTQEARAIGGTDSSLRKERSLTPGTARAFSLGVQQLGRRDKLKVNGLVSIRLGDLEIDIRNLEQLVCKEQSTTLGALLRAIAHQGRSVQVAECRQWTERLVTNGFRDLSPARCDYVEVRHFELMQTLSRIPSITVQSRGR